MSEYISGLLKIYYLIGCSVIGSSLIKEFFHENKLLIKEYSPESIELDEFTQESKYAFSKNNHIIHHIL